jgi:hypothetical protein
MNRTFFFSALAALTATPALAGQVVSVDGRSGAIVHIDTATGEVEAVTPILAAQGLQGLDNVLVAPDGSAWFTLEGTLYSLDLCTGRWEAAGALELSDACAMEVGVGGAIQVIDAAEDAMLTITPADGKRLGYQELAGDVSACGLASGEGVLYAVAHIDQGDGAFNVVMDSAHDGYIQLDVPGPASALAMDPDGPGLLLGAGRGLYRLDPITGETRLVASYPRLVLTNLSPAPTCSL